MLNLEKANSLSAVDRRKHKRIHAFLTNVKKELVTGEAGVQDEKEAFTYVKSRFDAQVADMKKNVERTGKRLHNLFTFVEEAFSEGNEMLVLVTELTVNTYSARYISMFGCEDYQKYNKMLMVSERQNILREDIGALFNE
jgi:hypothetical protein